MQPILMTANWKYALWAGISHNRPSVPLFAPEERRRDEGRSEPIGKHNPLPIHTSPSVSLFSLFSPIAWSIESESSVAIDKQTEHES